MSEKILIPPDFHQILRNKHILLDTSFFIDYSNHSSAFFDFTIEAKTNDITFVTNVPVVTEFTKGSENAEKFAEKTALVNTIIDYLLPIPPSVFTHELPSIVEKYGKSGATCSVTDMILASQIKMHANDLFLVTKNPNDFPSKVFVLKTYFLLQLNRALQVYGIYSYESK
jgi:predicted nucleic acid-binding protein